FLFTLGGDMSGFTGVINLGGNTGTGSVRLLNDATHSNTGSVNALFDLGQSTAVLYNRNGGIIFDLGGLTGGPQTILKGAGSTVNLTTYSIGALGTDTTFNGQILDGTGVSGTAAPVAITKVGAGTLTLGGSSSYSGPTSVVAGKLSVA